MEFYPKKSKAKENKKMVKRTFEIQNFEGYCLLPPSQIVSRLTFFTSSLTIRLIQKNLCKYSQI